MKQIITKLALGVLLTIFGACSTDSVESLKRNNAEAKSETGTNGIDNGVDIDFGENIQSSPTPNPNKPNSGVDPGSTPDPTSNPNPTNNPTQPPQPPQPKQVSSLIYDVRSTCSGSTCVKSCFAHETRYMHHMMIAYKRAFSRALNKNIDLRVVVTMPPGHVLSAKRPVMAFFHGGGLNKGTPTKWFPAAFYFASRGFVTATFQYRLGERDKATVAESTSDAVSAIRWLNLNAGKLGINPKQIITGGDSSGGYQSLMTSLYAGENDGALQYAIKPTLMMANYPVLNGMLAKYPKSLSPLHLAAGTTTPRILLLQGSADVHPWTPPTTAQNFCNSHANCTYFNFPGLGHDFMSGRESHKSMLTRMDQHLIKLKLISGDATKVASWVDGALGHCQMNTDQVKAWQVQYNFQD